MELSNPTISHRERVITIDDVLVAATSIANIDELKNHYDVRSTYTTELGRALAKRFDLATMRTLVAASQVDAAARANPDAAQGTVINLGTGDATAITNLSTAAFIIDTFRLIAQQMDENHVPSEDRFVILKPQEYYLLAGSESAAINRDFGGAGNIAQGKVIELVGLKIYSSPHLTTISNAEVASDDVNANNNPFDDADGASAGNWLPRRWSERAGVRCWTQVRYRHR